MRKRKQLGKEEFVPVIICVIIERDNERSVREILLQERWKPRESKKYLGILEIPGGKIDKGEEIEETVKREVYEETGLVVNILSNSFQKQDCYFFDNKTLAYSFQPFTCVQVLNEQNYIGLFVICRVKNGTLRETEEERNHRWVSISELEDLLKENISSLSIRNNWIYKTIYNKHAKR